MPFLISFFLIWINSIKKYFRWGIFDLHLPSALAKCRFVKQKWPFIEKKSPFPWRVWLNCFNLNKFLIFQGFLFETFSSHIFHICFLTWHIIIYMLNIKYWLWKQEIKLRCNVLNIYIFMLLKQHYGYLMLFIKLTI